jgi:hypothetical protein
MATEVTLTWAPPATRESGKPLNPADIAGFVVESSHDGAAFTKLTDSPPDAVSRVLPGLDYGSWQFRVSCFDKKNHVGAAAVGSLVIDDNTPPSMVLNLTVSITGSLATAAH